MDRSQLFGRTGLTLVLIGVAGALIAGSIAGAGLAYADNASFCGSCHSMRYEYSTWAGSQHKQFTCGDCHLPQDSLARKLYVKTESGVRDVYHETLRDYPENIRMRPETKGITDNNCLRCHAATVENTFMAGGGESCIKCHRGIVHGRFAVKEGVPLD